MTTALHPCPACQRHVRATETTCPLCKSPLELGLARPPTRRLVPHHQLTRALMAAGAISSAACGSNVSSSYGFAMGWDASEPDAGAGTADAGSVDAGVVSDSGTIEASHGSTSTDAASDVTGEQ